MSSSSASAIETRAGATRLAVVTLYALFFLSGAAALAYEVVWVRSLGLVFGGSHLAVATVLSVFMGGLALGGWIFGKRADTSRHLLRLYGRLEVGIALSACGFFALLRFYPYVYVYLARLDEASPSWLTLVRGGLAVLGMIVPTVLMGGTLPVLVRLVGTGSDAHGRHLAGLYSWNTLGAVSGTLAAGFFLLPELGVTRTGAAAVAVSLFVGLTALTLPRRAFGVVENEAARASERQTLVAEARNDDLALRLVLPGIAISGFCALGYEVLWTRVLTMVLGTSVYSFTILLATFLCGIAGGAQAASLLARHLAAKARSWTASAAAFGLVQVLIGLAALVVTYALANLPSHAVQLQKVFAAGAAEFGARQGATFLLAFAFMIVPAFFMGMAFPLAGGLRAARRGTLGRAVGEVLVANTMGAIAGAAASGYFLVRALGIERSLQCLALLNVGAGIVVLAALAAPRRRKSLVTLSAVAAGGSLAALVLWPGWGRAWDRTFFAIWRNNQRQAFDSPREIAEARANTEVLYFHEGSNETISVVRPRGAQQGFIVNGRVEASTSAQDRQCQLVLGHLPMLVHPSPRKVFVLGTGTGMTLGATTLHSEAEEIVVAEIEPAVIPAARMFSEWNHHALDDPRVRVVFNDGRNYLLTTDERFDVITADPIHPWSEGAAYLYTAEYFRLAASRLRAGGVACQWLPLYELTPGDLRSVVRSFASGFRHVVLWMTHYDAELLGSDAPIHLDLDAIDRRIAASAAIRADLSSVFMGSARDFASYFVAGETGLARFASEGDLNTDDNLWLEFHSAQSQGVASLMGDNVTALAALREPVAGYLAPAPIAGIPEGWEPAGALYDRAHAFFLSGRADGDDFRRTFGALRERFPRFAPGEFLAREVGDREAREPRLLDRAEVLLLRADGSAGLIELSVVGQRIGAGRGAVTVVDNRARTIYGERYVDADTGTVERAMAELAHRVTIGLRAGATATPRFSETALRARIAALLE